MKCPFCSHPEDKVIESRSTLDDTAIRRRRECLKCGRRYTSYEKIEGADLVVVKKDGRREPFSKEKIISGVVKAMEKCPVSVAVIHELVDDVERVVRTDYIEEVPTEFIGELIMERLHKIDQVAYVRFASVYRKFEDVKEFVDEVKSMPKTSAIKKGE